MKTIFCGKMLSIALGAMLVLTAFTAAAAQDAGEVSVHGRILPAAPELDSFFLMST